MTGNVLNGKAEIKNCQPQLNELYDELFGKKEEAKTRPKSSQPTNLSDKELVEKAMNAKNGDKFRALWEGNTNDYASQSEADLALCSMLAFWTGGDYSSIDRLFRQSGLYREKWDREDYRDLTINKALEGTTEFYEETQTQAPKEKKTKQDFSPYFVKDTFIPKRLADELMNEHSFIFAGEQLYVYANGVYAPIGERLVKQKCREKLGDEARVNRINEVIAHIEDLTYVDTEELNTHATLLNLKNGMFDWIEEKLLPHEPKYLSTIRIPVEYGSEATCPTVDYFFKSTLPSDCIPIAEEMFGYSLVPDVRFERAFMLVGGGANGKSTFLKLIEGFVGGENVAKIPLQELDEHRFKRAELFGKLINFFADLDARALKSSSYFKTIVSGDTIDAERKHRDPFFFPPHARLVYSANEIPQSPDRTFAYYRRWCIIPFPNRFVGKDADKSLIYKLTRPNELSGLLNRALKGLNRLFENETFTERKTVKEALEDYKRRNDTVKAFIDDCCQFNLEAKIERGEVYTAYTQYCQDEGFKAISRRACYDRIRAYPQVGEMREPQNRYFTGISVRQ